MYFMLFISRANPVFNFFTFYVMLKIFHADVHLSFVAPPALFSSSWPPCCQPGFWRWGDEAMVFHRVAAE
jgi:hypothetical protein